MCWALYSLICLCSVLSGCIAHAGMHALMGSRVALYSATCLFGQPWRVCHHDGLAGLAPCLACRWCCISVQHARFGVSASIVDARHRQRAYHRLWRRWYGVPGSSPVFIKYKRRRSGYFAMRLAIAAGCQPAAEIFVGMRHFVLSWHYRSGRPACTPAP